MKKPYMPTTAAFGHGVLNLVLSYAMNMAFTAAALNAHGQEVTLQAIMPTAGAVFIGWAMMTMLDLFREIRELKISAGLTQKTYDNTVDFFANARNREFKNSNVLIESLNTLSSGIRTRDSLIVEIAKRAGVSVSVIEAVAEQNGYELIKK